MRKRRGIGALLAARKNSHASDTIFHRDVRSMSYRLRGERDDKAFFEKVVLSCREQIINKLVLLFPKAQLPKFAPIIAKLDRRFHAGQGYETPRNCS